MLRACGERTVHRPDIGSDSDSVFDTSLRSGMFDLLVDGGDIEVYENDVKSLNLYRKERSFRRH